MSGRNKGTGNFGLILNAFYGAPWSILPAKYAEIEHVLRERIKSGHGFAWDDDRDDRPGAASGRGSGQDKGYTLLGSVAVVPISGTITPRPSMFSEYSGGTSAERIGAAMDAAVADQAVSSIVLDIDSPGGYVAGVPEAAAKIAGANKVKKVTAVANHLAASAAYWLGSQAGEIVVSPSAQVGSIGVLCGHVDETKMEEMLGVHTSLVTSTQSPFKTEGYPQVPLSLDARADMQKQVDALAQMFIDAVAKGRGIRSATVERDFGQGRMKLANEAVSARMADRVATLEQVVQQLNRGGSSRGSRGAGADARRKEIMATVARVIDDEQRDEQNRPARADTRSVPMPMTPDAVRLAAYRAERGLPTN